MKTVKGIYAEAKIFTDDVEEYAQAQVKMICDHQAAEGSRHLGEEVAEHYTKLGHMSQKERGVEIPYYMSYLEGDENDLIGCGKTSRLPDWSF